MAKKPTPKQKSRVTIRIDKSAKSPGSTTLDYRGLFMGEFAPDKEISNLDSKDDLIQIKKKKDLEEAIKQMEPSVTLDNVARLGSDDEDAVMPAFELKFRSMKDFHPDQIVTQVPDLEHILEVRRTLKTLKVKMLQDKRMRKLLEEILRNGDLDQLKEKLGPLADDQRITT